MMLQTLSLLLLVLSARSLYIGTFIPWNLSQQTVDSNLSSVMFRIMERYDLIALNGIPDADVMEDLFAKFQAQSCHYKMIISPALDKVDLMFPDINAFIYKENLMSLSNLVRDQESGAIYTKVKVHSSGYEFVFLAAHLAAARAKDEIALIPATYDRVVAYTKIQDVLMALTPNTGLLSPDENNALEINNNSTFQWYIDNYLKTVEVPGYNYAAQRFLGTNNINSLLLEETATFVNITEYFGLPPMRAAQITTQLPIEIEMSEKLP